MADTREFLARQLQTVQELLTKEDVSDADLRRLQFKRSVIEAWSSLMTGDASHHHDGNNHHDHVVEVLGAERRVIYPAALSRPTQQE